MSIEVEQYRFTRVLVRDSYEVKEYPSISPGSIERVNVDFPGADFLVSCDITNTGGRVQIFTEFKGLIGKLFIRASRYERDSVKGKIINVDTPIDLTNRQRLVVMVGWILNPEYAMVFMHDPSDNLDLPEPPKPVGEERKILLPV